jgi:fructose-1-phosphate kinase PfkB-like protein
MIEAGARGVAVSLGEDGIVWRADDEGSLLVSHPPPVKVRSTVGCGDAALAGFAVAHARGLDNEDMLRFAVACGTANCIAEAPGLVNAGDVERMMEQVSVQQLSTNQGKLKTGGGVR